MKSAGLIYIFCNFRFTIQIDDNLTWTNKKVSRKINKWKKASKHLKVRLRSTIWVEFLN